MCTAVNHEGFFGRTLDVDHDYDCEIVKSRGLIGMAYIADGVPLFFDAVNGYGLGGAALNFPGLAVYRAVSEKKYNIPSYDLIRFVLENCKDVREAEALLADVNITTEAFSTELPPTPLHWMFADASSSIVFEQTESGARVYHNETGVLTNAPTFPEHMNNIKKGKKPTDLSSESRFILAAEAKNSSAPKSAEEFFEMMESVFVKPGEGSTDKMKTVYTSCIDLMNGKYYCKNGENAVNVLSFGDQITELSSKMVYNMGVKTRNTHKGD